MNVVESAGNQASYAMGFEFYCNSGQGQAEAAGEGSPILSSILLSKQTGRYRVQSDELGGVLLILLELERRLVERLQQLQQRPNTLVRITYNDELPLRSYYDMVNVHYDSRVQ